MYFLTSLRITPSKHNIRTNTHPSNDNRCWGYYKDKEKAIQAATENWGDMEECYYEYLVIEHFSEGLITIAKEEIWYHWDIKLSRWVECKKPEELKRVVNFGIG